MDNFSDEARRTFAEAEFEKDPTFGLKAIGGSQLPLNEQEKAIAELHETINQLAARLKYVSTPVSETVAKEGLDGQKEPSISPLARQLQANNRGIRKATDNLHGLMQRLEI